ncbi:MAG: HAMP domain-containing histidine kinase [Planctomycetes bacterium]|nr:HAMP domain-containing histidine kinase [Planctomycetota bacterium]
MRRTHLLIFGSVLAAAAGLAVLAARSLEGQRVVLEQASAESGRRAASAAAAEWRARLDAAARAFLDSILESGSAGALATTLARLEDRPEVAAAFALDRYGRQTWPPSLSPVRAFVEALPGDEEARDSLARGYEAEFKKGDPAKALTHYAAAAEERFGQSVRVEAKFQEAALAAKTGATDRAIAAYTEALAMGRFAEPERVVGATLARARLRGLANPAAAETEVIELAESLWGADAGRFGTSLGAARSRVEDAMAAWPLSEGGRTRWKAIGARAGRERAASEARDRAVGLAATLARSKTPVSFAALDGGLLAAWKPRPGGACAGVVLRAPKLSLAGPGALGAPGGDWIGSAAPGGPSAPIPGVDGLAVTLPPSGEALAAGLWMSFRAVRREAELARLKSDFVSQVSHELKTPLALVRMYAETLSLGRVAEESQKAEYMAVIVREAERLSSMIEKILDFARLERGEKTFERRRGDLSAAIRESAATFQKTSGVAIDVQAPHPVQAAFDPDGLSLALRNLFENAVKYSEGAPEITVRVSGSNGSAVVAVEDHGIGIPAGERGRVFERFYRSEDPRAKKVKGTGLGLALVAGVMQGHGGTARCEPRPGGGSRFTLEFPRSTDAADDPGR